METINYFDFVKDIVTGSLFIYRGIDIIQWTGKEVIATSSVRLNQNTLEESTVWVRLSTDRSDINDECICVKDLEKK